MTDHRCDTGNFDRTLCAPPRDTMHSYCSVCGERQDECAHDRAEPAATVRAALVDSLATVPDDVLVEALVRRGVLRQEWSTVVGFTGRRGPETLEPLEIDPEVQTQDTRYVTAWQEADR